MYQFGPWEGNSAIAKCFGHRHMTFRALLHGMALLLLVSSCIPNKKVTMLQKDDVYKKDVRIDSIVRNYDMQSFDYRLQPNDVLNIRFGSLTDDKFDFLNKMQEDNGAAGGGGGAMGAGYIINGFLVDPNGKIEFPVVGKVPVAGLTVFEAQTKLQEIANEYLESPSVRVRLVNFRFTVLGEVDREGTTISYNNRVTLLEAIGLAGGLGALADRSKVKIVRTHGDRIEVAYVNLLDENFINSPYYYAYQNDVIIVPALRQRQYRKYFGQNLALIISTITLGLLVVSIVQK